MALMTMIMLFVIIEIYVCRSQSINTYYYKSRDTARYYLPY